MILYGLTTCDTCRKARKALEGAGHRVEFHDLRAQPLSAAQIASLLEQFGDRLINRSSTTWRGLSDAERAQTPATLLAAYPAVMKRPVIEDGDKRTLAWDKVAQAEWL